MVYISTDLPCTTFPRLEPNLTHISTLNLPIPPPRARSATPHEIHVERKLQTCQTLISAHWFIELSVVACAARLEERTLLLYFDNHLWTASSERTAERGAQGHVVAKGYKRFIRVLKKGSEMSASTFHD